MPAAMTRTERTIQWICRAVIAFVFALPVFLGARHGLLDIERNYVLESSLAGAFLIHMRAHPKPAEWLSALGIGSGLTVAYAFWHHGYGSSWEAAPFAYLTFLGTGSLTVLVGQIFFGARVARRLHRDTFFAAAAFPYFSFILAFYLHWTATLQQRTFDLSLYAFDEALQCHPSVILGGLLAQSPALAIAASLVYRSLPLAICFLVAVEREAPGRFPARILPLFVSVGLAAASLHNMYPALGPRNFFGKDFPGHLPSLANLALHPAGITAAHAAMPSIEFAFALLLWWNAARLALGWRLLAAGVVALTAVAALGFGDHYLVDLVVAVPLAVCVQAFALRLRSWQSSERRMAFWGGMIVTLFWIAALRAGVFLASNGIAWSVVAVTLTLAFWWNRGLDRGHRYLEKQAIAVRPLILPQEP